DPTAGRGDWDAETRTFARACWDAWWGEADAFLGRSLRKEDWARTGVRPANKPERRLMAAAMLFGGARSLAETMRGWAGREDGVPLDEMLRAFALKEAPYWSRRLSWGGERRKDEVALVGESRAKEVVANLVAPAMAALGEPQGTWRRRLRELPGGEANALHAETALRLFGQDHTPRLYRTGLRRQGLMHIHHEYCLGDRSRCAECPVPGLLKGFGP
ncbi:MAG: DUF2851 family protein, partial [Kiritimatiellae bacterium]|nr:DUF2851 family protein [Kiritimatiellia bacterium]